MNFIDKTPTLSTFWRSVILLGRNTACYKFALAQALLESGANRTSISTDDLAMAFAQKIAEHLNKCPKQSTGGSNSFLDACKNYNSSKIDSDKLVSTTKKLGFRYVFDAFHNVSHAEVPTFFRKNNNHIVLTDNFHHLLSDYQSSNLAYEVESRWRLWETAISLDMSPNLIEISLDGEGQFLVIKDEIRKIDITSSKDALNGYQKGKCFYCRTDIKIQSGFEDSCEVDHYFPHMLSKYHFTGLNQVWNLVLSCKNCNRGEGGKFERIPDVSFLNLLNKRNNFYVESHHPLRETILNQTGVSEPERRWFLQKKFNDALDVMPTKQKWMPIFQHGDTF